MDAAKLESIFNPKDHMNVKNAVILLSSIYDLLMSMDLESLTPDMQTLALLGRFCGFLVRPFKTPSMSLSLQLKSLSAAGHLLLVLFRLNPTSFCPGQRYYDIQSMIKNAFWTVAKQQLLDEEQHFYITQLGEDRLEVTFGIYRLKDNSQNVDILQLAQRASSTAETTRIFARHPDWDRGHQRLRMEGVEGVDHTNPRSWIGDVHKCCQCPPSHIMERRTPSSIWTSPTSLC